MPANVGEMFCTGDMPWYAKGIRLAQPATLEEALKAGGINWRVGEVNLQTADDPPSPAPTRKALVRLDRPPGHPRRVLGVCHQGFRPLQNSEGAAFFDAIFGQGKRVYHTGGYLGSGEVIWLLARIDGSLEVVPGDVTEPYALFTNSHDGSVAIHIKLTTVRVLCSNTLALALADRKLNLHFSRGHQASLRSIAREAREYFADFLQQLEELRASFEQLGRKTCSETHFRQILEELVPEPTLPERRSPGQVAAFERRRRAVQDTRTAIGALRVSGRGMDIAGVRGTFWGALNAVTEYVDHHREVRGSRIAYALLGQGMALKVRAYKLIRDLAAAA